jgi:hypothetical protein
MRRNGEEGWWRGGGGRVNHYLSAGSEMGLENALKVSLDGDINNAESSGFFMFRIFYLFLTSK